MRLWAQTHVVGPEGFELEPSLRASKPAGEILSASEGPANVIGGPGGIRTPNQGIMSPLL